MRHERPDGTGPMGFLLRAGLLSAAVACALLLPGRAEAVIPTPAWLSPSGSHFAVTTTGAWELGGAEAGGAHAKAKVVHVLDRVYPQSSEAIDRQGRTAVWAPTCLPGAQTIRVRRTVEVPGPPGKVSAAITPWTTSGFRIASASLYVNGQLLAKTRAGGQGGFSPTASKVGLFKFGQNTIELVATKAPNPAGSPSCNVSARTQLGVFAWVKGDFATDLALVEPKPADQAFDASGPEASSSVTGQINFSVRNKGPGGAARGLFHLTLALPISPVRAETTFDIDPVGDGPFGKCTYVKSNVATYEATCVFSDFRAGTTQLIRVLYRSAGAKAAAVDVSASVRWNVHLEGEDTNPSNNERLVKLWFCEFGVADGGKSCKLAP
jgi:hypothetical protein